jgi:hypothetical protein
MEKERLKFVGIYLANWLSDIDLVVGLIQGGFSVSEIEELGFDYWYIIKSFAELYNEGEFDSVLKEEGYERVKGND